MSNQPEVIEEIEKFLSPDSRIDTLLSVVFLKDRLAYKLKREIKNGFLDYSSLQKRKALCKREFQLNQKNSPELYKGVVSVYRSSEGALQFWGGEELPSASPVEYLLEMNRFEEDLLLSRLAVKGSLTEEICGSLAEKIAKMHNAADPVASGDYTARFLNVVNIIIRQFRDSASGVARAEELDVIPHKLLATFNKCRAALSARGNGGFIKECHGDLHLGNICLFNGVPCIFDAVEFNTEFTHIDTLYDLSFLIMDLHHHGLSPLAVKVSGSYLAGTGINKDDYMAVMPFYLGLRSIIRCSITAASSKGHISEEMAAGLRRESLQYLRETLAFLS